MLSPWLQPEPYRGHCEHFPLYRHPAGPACFHSRILRWGSAEDSRLSKHGDCRLDVQENQSPSDAPHFALRGIWHWQCPPRLSGLRQNGLCAQWQDASGRPLYGAGSGPMATAGDFRAAAGCMSRSISRKQCASAPFRAYQHHSGRRPKRSGRKPACQHD